MAWDMYIEQVDWRYAYTYGVGRYALVSAARMGDGQSNDKNWSPQVLTRVTKMVDKRVALQLLNAGLRSPLPDVLKVRILGPEDLDRLDGDALTRVLMENARPQVAQSYPDVPVIDDNTTRTNPERWSVVFIALGLCVGVMVLLSWLSYKSNIVALSELEELARQNSWQFSRLPSGKGAEWNFTIKGEQEGVPFVAEWTQTGSGKNISYQTALHYDIETAAPTHIMRRGLLLWGFKLDRVKTNDALYDCKFFVQSKNPNWRLPDALRRVHPTMPVAIDAELTRLTLTHTGRANKEAFKRMLEVGRAWKVSSVISVPTSAERDDRGAILACWFGKAALPIFWSYFALSFVMLWLSRGTENSNRPWSLAFHFMAPAVLAGIALWLLRTRIWQQRKARLAGTLGATLAISAFIWLLSGFWILGWNAMTGDADAHMVLGQVTGLSESHGKGGPSYSIIFRDTSTARAVDLQVNRATYESLSIGDPVAFKLLLGGLGLYQFPTPTLMALRARWSSLDHAVGSIFSGNG
jgi:hypothetical protein